MITVFTNGCFDILHAGHVEYLQKSRALGDKLIVGLNSDVWLVRKKGKSFMNFSERSEILKSFRSIDEVMSFSDDDNSAINLLMRIQTLYPECTLAFANGGDRVEGNTPEKGFCNAYNIDMIWGVGGTKIQSSSYLINSVVEKQQLNYDKK